MSKPAIVTLCGAMTVACVGHEPALPSPARGTLTIRHACQPPDPIGGPLVRECAARDEPYDIVVFVDTEGSVVSASTKGPEGRERDCTAAMKRRRFRPATTCMGEPLAGEYRVHVPEIRRLEDEHKGEDAFLPPLPLTPTRVAP
jgi:hypothetical protein